MADIHNKILGKYGIDIAQDNIFKLYKIDSAEISLETLEVKIQETHKRWNTSINGANEKNAERDKARLDKADIYEKILRDDKLRKEVFDYCNGEKKGSSDSGNDYGSGVTAFAEEYFELVATTKKIRTSDIEFFFKYFQSERKHKKAILEMLRKKMKIGVLDVEDNYETDEEGKRKNESSILIVNLFSEATILKIRRVLDKYDEAIQNNELCQRYPKLREGIFEFLEIKDVEDAKQFTELMSLKSKEMYAVRQEHGAEYVPLVDMFNLLQSIGEYQDVVDNITEVKLLLKYPSLTPYMYSFVDMKPATIKGLLNVANREYSFRDDTDFVLNYYKPVHDNFGISDSGISMLLRKAEKNAKKNKVLNVIDEKLHKNKNKRTISIGIEILHWLVYWPIVAVYFVFEVFKAVFTELHRFAIPVFVAFFSLESYICFKADFPTLDVLLNLFTSKGRIRWVEFISDLFGNVEMLSSFETVMISLTAIAVLLLMYVLPGYILAYFIAEFSDNLNKHFDWVGYERTFQTMFIVVKMKTEEQCSTLKKLFIRKSIFKIIINTVCLAIIVAAVMFLASR